MIKNLIFDLGNVLLPIDFNAPVKAFQDLGIKDFHTMYGKMSQVDLFDRLETGKISDVEFRNEIRALLGFHIADDEIDKAWNSILLEFRPTVFDMLRKLKNKYRLFLLSNTNVIHARGYESQLSETFNINALASFFEKAYYSHEVGMRKPDREIFEFVLSDANITAADTMFIDDNIDNINTAAAMGFKVHHMLPTEKVENLFDY